MADKGRDGIADTPSPALIFLSVDFFEKVERDVRILLDVKMRFELDKAYGAVWLSVPKRRATTPRAANALDALSKKAKYFLVAFNEVERNFPGLLDDVKDHVFDDNPDQILPLVLHKRPLLDNDVWDGAIAVICILAMGSEKKSENIRKRIPRSKRGPRRHVEVDALIRTAIRVFQDAGRQPAIGGSLKGPFPRFLRELYHSFQKDLRPEIAPSADAFVSRARDVLNGG